MVAIAFAYSSQLFFPPILCHLPLMGDVGDRLGYWKRIRNYLRRRGRTLEDAEDLVQEAFLRLELYCREGREVLQPEAFLMRTACNLSVSHHRHVSRSPFATRLAAGVEPAALAHAPDEVLAAEQRLEKIKQILDAVSHRTRDIFLLHRVGGFSYAEIAQQLGISVSAVEKHIASGATALALERQENER
jgi:RNA polymerase sigma factor (sigma-70 family)